MTMQNDTPADRIELGARIEELMPRAVEDLRDLVAIPSIVAELTFTIWLLLAGRRSSAVTRDDLIERTDVASPGRPLARETSGL